MLAAAAQQATDGRAGGLWCLWELPIRISCITLVQLGWGRGIQRDPVVRDRSQLRDRASGKEDIIHKQRRWEKLGGKDDRQERRWRNNCCIVEAQKVMEKCLMYSRLW